ncbi:MAG: hypothetical protein ACRCXC_06565 [Legionella sp.]
MNGHLKYSTDDRATWIDIPVPNAVTSVNGIYITNGKLYISSADGIEGSVHYTDVGQSNWTKIAGPGGVNGLALQ